MTNKRILYELLEDKRVQELVAMALEEMEDRFINQEPCSPNVVVQMLKNKLKPEEAKQAKNQQKLF